MEYRTQLYQKYFENQANKDMVALKSKLLTDFEQIDRDIDRCLPEDKSIRILDLGCGYGNLLMYLQSKGYTNTIGIDISEDQVRIAKQLGLNNVHRIDIFDFFEETHEKFDLIIGLDIIEHFSKDELLFLLKQIKGTLTDRGRAIFRTPNVDGIQGTIYSFGDYTHEILLNASSSRQIMKTVGFKFIQVLPSALVVQGLLKKVLQKISWAFISFWAKAAIFASARSTQNVVLTPNLIIVVE